MGKRLDASEVPEGSGKRPFSSGRPQGQFQGLQISRLRVCLSILQEIYI